MDEAQIVAALYPKQTVVVEKLIQIVRSGNELPEPTPEKPSWSLLIWRAAKRLERSKYEATNR